MTERTRIHLRIDPSDIKELRKMTGTVSEHIRRAVKEYIKNKFNVSTTPTKEVDIDG